MTSAKEETPQEERNDGDTADLAKAYRELAKGEQTAAAMEANLTNLESKLDAMLAALEKADGKSLNEGDTKETK